VAEQVLGALVAYEDTDPKIVMTGGFKSVAPCLTIFALVFGVEREVPKAPQIARAALDELLKGPTDTEQGEGYFTSINGGVEVDKLTIDAQGTARVEFSPRLEEAVGGSCRVAAIRAQIIQTLKQFSTVKEVVISINGRTEDILQP